MPCCVTRTVVTRIAIVPGWTVIKLNDGRCTKQHALSFDTRRRVHIATKGSDKHMGAFDSEGDYREARQWLSSEEIRLGEERQQLLELGLPADEVSEFLAISQARFDRVSRDVQA